MATATGSDLSPVPLMQISTGFWASKALAAAHELGLFSRLSGSKGTTAEELARAVDLHERPAEMLLTACTALGLLDKTDGRYRNSALAEEFLVPGKPHYFGGWVAMLDKRLYPGWGKLGQALRSNRPTTWDPDKQASLFDGEDPDMLALFWGAMHSLSSMTARVLGETFDFGRFSRLLDVGGGSGAYTIELCRQHPELRATVYDLPFVVDIASGNIETAGRGKRIGTVGGNFFEDAAFPPGHDAILLSMILHDWSEPKNREILGKCFEALPSGGTVVVVELLVNDEKTGPVSAALMSLNMLIETEGRNYTAAEYGAWLNDAGFTGVETIHLDAPGANGALVAHKP